MNKELFDEMLNEVYPSVKIGEIEFFAADILKNCDPIAYRCYLADFESDMEEVA